METNIAVNNEGTTEAPWVTLLGPMLAKVNSLTNPHSCVGNLELLGHLVETSAYLAEALRDDFGIEPLGTTADILGTLAHDVEEMLDPAHPKHEAMLGGVAYNEVEPGNKG